MRCYTENKPFGFFFKLSLQALILPDGKYVLPTKVQPFYCHFTVSVFVVFFLHNVYETASSCAHSIAV